MSREGLDKVANTEMWLHLWGMLLEEQGDQDLLFCLREVGRADGGRAGMCHPAKKWGAEGTAAAGKTSQCLSACSARAARSLPWVIWVYTISSSPLASFPSPTLTR